MSIKTEFPDVIDAGFSVKFAVHAYDLEGNELKNSDGFTCYAKLNNESNNYTVSTTTDSTDGFLFEIPSDTTEGWTVGKYNVSIIADDGTNRYQVAKKFTEIKPDLFTATYVDSRSTARQIRDALEQTILGSATQNQLSMSIAGRSISRMSLEELIKAKNVYDGIVALEEKTQANIDGKNISNSVQVRFR